MARIVVVTPNPAVDVTYEVPRQVLGGSVRVRRVLRRPGGKGVNVVRVLRTLGHDALAVHPLGGDTGRWLHEELEAEGVRTRSVPAAHPTRTTVTVVGDGSDPTLYAEPGPHVPVEAWAELVAIVGHECEPGSTLVVAGSLPPGTDPALLRTLVHTAHQAGAVAVVDTGGDALLTAADAGADLIKVNAAEALEATGGPDAEAAVAALLDRGARCVVVSLGAGGLIAALGDHDADAGGDGGPAMLRQAAVPGVHGNPTGAGDAATAGIVAARVVGAPLAEALRWGVVVGAAAVLRPTAGEVRAEDLAVLSARLGDRARSLDRAPWTVPPTRPRRPGPDPDGQDSP
jgi:tagatose 6-phosphate kinase